MKSDDEEDIRHFQKTIRLSYEDLEKHLSSSQASITPEVKQKLEKLQRQIKKMLKFSLKLNKYGNESFQSLTEAKKEIDKLKIFKKKALEQLTEKHEQIIVLQKKILQQEREIARLKMINKIEVSYVSSVELANSESIKNSPDCSLDSMSQEMSSYISEDESMGKEVSKKQSIQGILFGSIDEKIEEEGEKMSLGSSNSIQELLRQLQILALQQFDES